MKVVERKAMIHHSIFSILLCIAMLIVIIVRSDVSGLILGGFMLLYVGGNTLLHYWHHDFRKETLYEYMLVSIAVAVILYGALKH